ncbi:hypothetical protein W02_27930 [Nitrospira sp. KM1]|uniref:hypothetical protein n=1 Tax=Nitrospira sp. KM1 TaxID=1936990 RepID=UPI0013A7A8F0|nr:hypothetical protein [Nitrospira sp. KM1]BCA55653.1 hypothetical protein W02_27930 [Nitrospira sp. KM1]
MNTPIKDLEDVRWLLGHTGGFRGGYVTDVHMSKRRLYDEGSAREVLTDTTVSIIVRYRIREMARVAKLTMIGVSDFSIFEQEGADCSRLEVVQAEWTAGKLRFWFDPQGELYVVCDEASLEEVAMPFFEDRAREHPIRWTFQSPMADWPTVEWLLDALHGAGVPCTWKKTARTARRQSSIQWEGELLPTSDAEEMECGGVRAMLYGPLDGPGFGVVLQVEGAHNRAANRILSTAADLLVRRFSGRCLVGNTIIPGGEWLSWKTLEYQRAIDSEPADK